MNALTTPYQNLSKTIQNLEVTEDIAILVEDFYEKVFVDETIRNIFTDFMNVRSETHFPIMIKFWETVLLAKNACHDHVIMKHINIYKAAFPLKSLHFDKWIELFLETIDESFKVKISEVAKIRAKSIAMVLQAKINFYQEN